MNTEPFYAAAFLYTSELEFRWLLEKLGNDKWYADLRAFQMTGLLAEEIRRLETLWNNKTT